MRLGSRIAQYRKEKCITQESLAQMLNVTNQAVSKWELDQCCPDIQMLPKLADIFEVSIDELFGREGKKTVSKNNLPWKDDKDLRVVLFQGHKLLKNSNRAGEFTFRYEGPAVNISSAIDIHCGDVQGNADAGADIKCGNVDGDVNAGADVYCGHVSGHVDAGADVTCGNVTGNLDAGSDVRCGNVEGSIDAGGDVHCGDVFGDIDAGGSVTVRKCL